MPKFRLSGIKRTAAPVVEKSKDGKQEVDRAKL
jgi:hypothetical protein